MNITLDDIKEAIKVKLSEDKFMTYFEVTIYDLVERFSDLIEDRQEELSEELELNVEETFIESYYEDRE